MQLKTNRKSTIWLFSTVFILLFHFQASSQNVKLKDNKINKIEFIYEGNASKPHYSIAVFRDKTLILNAIKNNFLLEYEGDIIPFGRDELGKNIRESEIKGVFKNKLKKKVYKEIVSLIDELNGEFLQKTFNSEVLHSSIGKLKVTYGNGDVKLIYDSGLAGSKTLIKLYKIFENLRKNTNWV